MFAYLVIGFELAILYTVFWYVFIREPKPFKIRADQWGRYQRGPNNFTAYGADRHLPAHLTDEINERQLYNYYYNQARRRAQAHRRRIQRANAASSYEIRQKEQLPIESSVTQGYDCAQRSTVERFIATLGRAISHLSAKSPLA